MSSRTSHSIDKPLFIRWWTGLFVFTIWSATELKKKYLGEGSHLDPPNIYTMVMPLTEWTKRVYARVHLLNEGALYKMDQTKNMTNMLLLHHALTQMQYINDTGHQ